MSRPALALLAAFVLGGCSNVLGTVEKAAELAAEGDARVLREPMRPVRGTDRVLVLALDGVGQDALTDALAAGDLPALGALFGGARDSAGRGGGLYEQAVIANQVASVFPSETVPGWAAVFTGAPPARSGVPGNEWFDRDSAAVYAPVPVSVFTLEHTLAVWTDSLLSGAIAAPTVYERADLRSHVSLAFVYRGADLLTPPDASDVGGVAEAAVETVFGGVDEAYAELDEDAWEGVRRGVEAYGLPDLQVAYFPGPDLVAHAQGPEARYDYLRDDVDPLVGRVLDLYRERGALGSTTVVVVSDHGHTEVLEDDRHSLDTGGADEPPALLDALGWRVHDFEIGPVASDADVVMTYNEAVATLTVADRSTCPEPGDACDWTAPPRLEEDVLPLARALQAASASADTAAVGGLSGTLDLVLARASDPSGRTSPPFRVLYDGELVPVADYLARVPRPDLVAFEERLSWLTNGPLGHRAGDVLLLAKAGAGWPLDERFYFGSPRRSAHGSAAPSDSYVALAVAREGASGAVLRETVRAAVGEAPTQLDVTRLVLALLGVEGGT